MTCSETCLPAYSLLASQGLDFVLEYLANGNARIAGNASQGAIVGSFAGKPLARHLKGAAHASVVVMARFFRRLWWCGRSGRPRLCRYAVDRRDRKVGGVIRRGL